MENNTYYHNKKDLRCTQFEYSSSDSDSDDKNNKKNKKLNFQNISRKKYKSSNNLEIEEENIEKKNKKRKKSKIYLSRYIRLFLFFLLLIFSVITDLDEGIIVSSYKSFIKDLNISDIQYGTLNSITPSGKILSLIIYMILINKNHRKFILVFTSFLHGISFYLYFFNDNYYYIAIVKFLTSFCKIFITIYIPVWIDQFGIKKFKTLLLTIVYMVISYGRIIGACLGTVIFNNEWKKAFSCCGGIFLILSFCLFIIPQKYFSTKYMIVEKEKKFSGNIVEKIVPTKDIEIKKEIENINDIEYLDENNNKNNLNNNFNNKKEKLIYDYDDDNNNKNIYKNLSIINKFKIVLVNKCFIFSSLSRACLFFIFRIIHTYLKQYTFEALNYNNEIKFFYYYSLTTILAPTLGSLIGGAICNKFLGGYESKNSIYIIIFFNSISIFFITLIRNSADFNYLIIFIFAYFFCVSAYLPTLSGYIINSLNKELKGFGSSFDSLIINIIGKLPSPIIYGILYDQNKNMEPKYAWNKCLMIYYMAALLIYLTCVFKYKLNDKNIIKKKLKNKKNEIDIVEQTMKDYTLYRSNLLRADKPIPKYNNNKDNKFSDPHELNDFDDKPSTSINTSSKNNNINE